MHAQALWALATLRVSPPPSLPPLLLQSSRPHLPAAPAPTLALLLWALSALRFRPSWQWQLDFFQATLRAPPPPPRAPALPPRSREGVLHADGHEAGGHAPQPPSVAVLPRPMDGPAVADRAWVLLLHDLVGVLLLRLRRRRHSVAVVLLGKGGEVGAGYMRVRWAGNGKGEGGLGGCCQAWRADACGVGRESVKVCGV